MSTLFIYGKNAVLTAIKANCDRIIKIFLSKNFNNLEILFLIKKKKIKNLTVENNILNKLAKTTKHQNIIAEIKTYTYYSLSDIINNDINNNINNVIIMLDSIEDPHNFGAILRICDAFNVTGIIIKKKSQVSLNATVSKVSSGAINYVKVIRVSNLNNTIEKLKEKGYLIIATDNNVGVEYTKLNYKMPIVIIIGGENKGISFLTKKNSDTIIKIPMYGKINSLNASNALSIVLSHIIYICKKNKNIN